MRLPVVEKELFEGFLKGIKAHAKGNEEEFGKALVTFGLENFTTLKETGSDMFEGGDGIDVTVYT
ncbi:MAG: hypothetical protein Q8O19_02050 [Rectinemataceae bacterium]|nr:hypothetical protein [Rectinemataceae bacterium]